MSALDCPEVRGRRVLIVDDDLDTRELLATVLECSGAVVATAESVSEALIAFERQRPHILISDIGLPGEDGFSLVRRVRALPPSLGGDVPAIALSGYDSAEDREQASREGFQQHLTKPVAPEAVLGAVARALALTGSVR